MGEKTDDNVEQQLIDTTALPQVRKTKNNLFLLAAHKAHTIPTWPDHLHNVSYTSDIIL